MTVAKRQNQKFDRMQDIRGTLQSTSRKAVKVSVVKVFKHYFTE